LASVCRGFINVALVGTTCEMGLLSAKTPATRLKIKRPTHQQKDRT
jgi:hypothetical protein